MINHKFWCKFFKSSPSHHLQLSRFLYTPHLANLSFSLFFSSFLSFTLSYMIFLSPVFSMCPFSHPCSHLLKKQPIQFGALLTQLHKLSRNLTPRIYFGYSERLLFSCPLIYKIPHQSVLERHKARIMYNFSADMGIAIFLITWRTMQSHVFKVMDASFPGMCGDYLKYIIHLLICYNPFTTIVRIEIAQISC